jgi:hypothetical protein
MMGRRARLGALGGVLLALVGVGVVVLVNDGGDEKPSGGDETPNEAAEPDGVMAELWRTPSLEVSAPDDPEAGTFERVWLADGVVVLVTRAGAWGFDPESGDQLWRLEHPDGGNLAPCAASDDVNDQGIGAVIFEPEEGGGCTGVAAVDTGSGEVTWSEEVPVPQVNPLDFADGVRVAVGERVITVNPNTWTSTPRRFAVADGEELPGFEVPFDLDRCEGEESAWHATAEHAVLGITCARPGDEPQGRLALFDTETGERLWTRSEEPWFAELPWILADEPLALMSLDRVNLYEADGDPRVEIPLDYVDPNAGLSTDEVAASYQMADWYLVDSVLITLSTNGDGQDRVRGIDVRTGQQLWQRELPEDRALAGLWHLLGDADEERMVFYAAETGNGDSHHHVAWLDRADGDLTVEGLLPYDSNAEALSFPPAAAWDDQTLYVTEEESTEGVRLHAVRRAPGSP